MLNFTLDMERDEVGYLGEKTDREPKLLRLNPVSFIFSRQGFTREDLRLAPSKVQRRLMLTDSCWCRMGTAFVPPGEPITLSDLNLILEKMNVFNQKAGRPNDTDLVIRTASKFGILSSWAEPAFLATDVHMENPRIISMETFRVVDDYKKSMIEVKHSWKMLHTDNLPLQKKAIHGRLQVDRLDFALDLGSNMVHARGLEKGDKTNVAIPLDKALNFFNTDSFIPNSLTIQGADLSGEDINHFMDEYAPAGTQLANFVDWVSSHKGIKKYVAEFRYYTSNCKNSERFHIMDLDVNY